MVATAVERVEKTLENGKKVTKKKVGLKLLSTGSTRLNLACSGRARGGFAAGTYNLVVGDSKSGKTFLALTCFAEALLNSHFKNYRFIYDNGENGALMDIKKFFGLGVLHKLEPPRGTKQRPRYSRTVEDLYDNVNAACDAGDPFIYVEDSMDVLGSRAAEKKYKKQRTARRKEESTGEEQEVAGSYGTDKARVNSEMLPKICHRIRETGSIFIIISQTRDNIGKFSFDTKTRSGGHALRFYAAVEIWSSVAAPIKKTVNDIPRKIGARTKIAVKKNRLSGVERFVEIPIYYSIGFDDLGSCVDYLVEERHWTRKKGIISAPEFDFTGKPDKLIQRIESEGLEENLRDVVQGVWDQVEEKCKVVRKPRYK